MQLVRLLQSQGFGSRRDCRSLVAAGRVSVDGVICRDAEREFPTEALVLELDGQDWTFRERAYLVLNKPAGYECSRQPRHHPSVFALLPAPLLRRGVQCVGRLDEDTTGLLLFSDDGDFVHRHTSPKQQIGKTYRVSCKHALTPSMLAALRNGVQLHDEAAPIAARACLQIDPQTLDLTIAEGKYHQVKRMLAAAGNRVEALHRTAVGAYILPADLATGAWRWLTPADIENLGQRNGPTAS